MEIDKKFTTGKSSFDDPHIENILGDSIDIKRYVKPLPTLESYKAI
jgi:hypothetical protein